jgi:hypothetical protein
MLQKSGQRANVSLSDLIHNRKEIFYMKKTTKLLKALPILALGVLLSGCDFTPDDAGGGYNAIIIGIAILAAATLVFFIILAIISAFYRGKDVQVKIVKKIEPKVLEQKNSAGYRGATTSSRRTRRQKGRIRYSKITIESDGNEKTIRCSDIVIFDKLIVGKNMKIRIRFGEVVKILK